MTFAGIRGSAAVRNGWEVWLPLLLGITLSRHYALDICLLKPMESLQNGRFEYQSKLSLIDTQHAIKVVKDTFQQALATKLNLTRVSAPLFVAAESGLNDDLNGYERPISFEFKSKAKGVIIHSLAKWKRMALKRYDFEVGSGLYTDMNAIRRDEDLSPIHSYYVDQWDWEVVIRKEDRTYDMLKDVVERIYEALKELEEKIVKAYPCLTRKLPDSITFVSSQELEDLYPEMTPKERERVYSKKYGAIFITQIGKTLKSGNKHDGRAPDYDDWELNGDIIVYYEPLDIGLELSSMGIRVDEEAMERQLKLAGQEKRKQFDFHRRLLNGELPYTVGGGIGQSRLCLFFLDKVHIGEVQVSLWSDEIVQDCLKKNIHLL
ncbi:hypothetical protein AAHC03_026484 [Spirometra sp. Aus1]